jgi:tetratricopeptide (TPR) repeat protein
MSISRWKQRPALLIGVLCLAGLSLATYLLFAPTGDSALRAAQTAIDQRNFASALEVLNRHLEQHPNDLSVRILAAESARRNADYDQASRHLRHFELSDGPPLALELERRLLSVQTGNPEQAALVYAFCREMPDSPETPLVLEALIVGDLGRLTRPLATPDPLPLTNQPPELHRLLETTELWLNKRPGRADQVQGLVWRGRALRLAGDHPGAIADLERAVELDPDDFDARVYLALSIGQDRPQESIAHFKVLQRHYPADLRLQFALATGHRGIGELDEAKKWLDSILRDQPDNAQVLLERARVALDERKPAEAKGFLDRAADVGADQAQLHLVLARYMTAIGDNASARHHQEQFQELDAQRSKGANQQ